MDNIKNGEKGNLKFDLSECRQYGNRHAGIALVIIILPLILLCPASSRPDDKGSIWDKPFDKPQYLLHATGHGTMDGPRDDDWWFLFPNPPDGKKIELPDGMGGTFTYTLDHSFGPFTTPSHVCAACSDQIGDRNLNAWGSDESFSCKDLAAQSGQKTCSDSCKGDNPEKHVVWDGQSQYPDCSCVCDKGYHFNSNGDCVPDDVPSGPSGSASASGTTGGAQIQVATPQGTASIRPGEKAQLALTPGKPMSIQALCEDLEAKINLIELVYDEILDDRAGTRSAEEREAIFLIHSTYMAAHLSLCSKFGPSSYTSLDYDAAASSSSEGSPLEMRLELQQGPVRAEVIEDLVLLDIQTPTVVVSSLGKNAFGVAYDPASGKSFVTAYQHPVQVRPMSGDTSPFTLEPGQSAEVGPNGINSNIPAGPASSSSAAMQGGCYQDPQTGEIVCVDNNGETSNQGVSSIPEPITQGGCYTDPYTGRITCIDGAGSSVNQGEVAQGECYQDPQTGEITCVDTYGDSLNLDVNIV